MTWATYNDAIEILAPCSGFLAGRGANLTSQNGEDGLIAAWLERNPPVNRWCFEVGAHDGRYLSNTLALREQGWKAVLIEGEAEQYEKLRRLQSPLVVTVPKRIDANSLDKILSDCGAPPDIDLGVIDIDGMDYWVWDGLRNFRPRLMVVEFDPYQNDLDFIHTHPGDQLSGYGAILKLGHQKGYRPLAKTRCNILFAANETLGGGNGAVA